MMFDLVSVDRRAALINWAIELGCAINVRPMNASVKSSAAIYLN